MQFQHVMFLVGVAAISVSCSDSSGEEAPEPSTADRGVVFRATLDHSLGELYFINKDGSGLRRLTTDTIYDDDPAVSPDGQLIAYTCGQNDNIDICLMSITGANQVRLTTDPAIDFYPAWSPDGQTIVFTSERGDQFGRDLWAMDPAGGNQQALTNGGDAIYFETASFSPLGDRLVLTVRTIAPAMDLDFINSDGSGLVPFQATAAQEERAVWSPDGNRLAYTETIGGDVHLVVRRADGVELNTIVAPDRLYYDVSWSHDGHELVAACETYQATTLCRGTPSGKGLVPIPNIPTGADSPDWVE